MEAQAFAYLAARRLKNLPLTFPMTTGVKAPLNGGVIARPALLPRRHGIDAIAGQNPLKPLAAFNSRFKVLRQEIACAFRRSTPPTSPPSSAPLYDDMRQGIAGNFKGFIAVRDDGALLGPWNFVAA